MSAALDSSPARPAAARRQARAEVVSLVARWVLGGVFLYMGLVKALAPDKFLISLYHYGLIHDPVALNAIAGVLPWLEIVCGLLLIFGVAVRGSALVLLLMLLTFNCLVFRRAAGLAEAKALAFCAVKFDCGCGNGEVFACHKLAQNSGLILVSIWLLAANTRRWCARFSFFARPVTPDRVEELAQVER